MSVTITHTPACYVGYGRNRRLRCRCGLAEAVSAILKRARIKDAKYAIKARAALAKVSE